MGAHLDPADRLNGRTGGFPSPSKSPSFPQPLCTSHLQAKGAAVSACCSQCPSGARVLGRGISLFHSHLFMNSISLSFLKTTEL